MQPQSMHHMEFVSVHPSGAEEWACPECGRRLLIQWSPSFRKITLQAGDESASHSGASGHLHMEAGVHPASETTAATAYTDVLAHPEEFGEPEQTDGLDPWRRMIDNLGNGSNH